jgi:hypothetical protein
MTSFSERSTAFNMRRAAHLRLEVLGVRLDAGSPDRWLQMTMIAGNMRS